MMESQEWFLNRMVLESSSSEFGVHVCNTGSSVVCDSSTVHIDHFFLPTHLTSCLSDEKCLNHVWIILGSCNPIVGCG